MKDNKILTPYEWTNGGSEVMILRFSNRDGTAYGGFQHPVKIGETITAPDWNEAQECGGGIHGWAWGHAFGDGKEPEYSSNVIWQVYGVLPHHIRRIEGKCKFKTGTLRFTGTWSEAINFINPGRIAWTSQASRGAASATGESGAASATGESGAASATGYSGAASATGYSGAASATGSRGAASATGESGAASATGLNSKAMAGDYGCIALAWWNDKENRIEMRCATTGPGMALKSHTWYKMDIEGNFVEV